MRPEHYRQYAFDCLRLAHSSTEPETKAVLLDMAMAWMRLSEQVASFHRHPYLLLVSDNENSLTVDSLLPERKTN